MCSTAASMIGRQTSRHWESSRPLRQHLTLVSGCALFLALRAPYLRAPSLGAAAGTGPPPPGSSPSLSSSLSPSLSPPVGGGEGARRPALGGMQTSSARRRCGGAVGGGGAARRSVTSPPLPLLFYTAPPEASSSAHAAHRMGGRVRWTPKHSPNALKFKSPRGLGAPRHILVRIGSFPKRRRYISRRSSFSRPLGARRVPAAAWRF